MGLEAKFTGDIDGMFKAFLLEVERQIIESLCRIGEEADRKSTRLNSSHP